MNERDLKAQLLAVRDELSAIAEAIGVTVPSPGGPVVDARVALEVGFHEAIIREAYRDSTGRWTWSVGLTSATGHNVERYIDRPTSLQRCIDIYAWALRRYAEQVRDRFAGFALSQAAFAGAVSFHWNTGAIRSDNCRWPALYMDGKHASAEASFVSYNRAGGKVDPVLQKRRRLEANLIWRGIWSSNGTMTEFDVVRKTHRPDWSSARFIDVRDEMALAFGGEIHPEIDSEPDPDAEPAVPTLTTVRPETP